MTKGTMEKRWKEHCYASKLNKANNYFYNALNLYGVDNWVHEILVDGITEYEKAQELERYYIKMYDTFENGYNTTYGGEGVRGYVYSEEEKMYMSKERRNRNGNKIYSFYNPELDMLEKDIHPMDLANKYNIFPGNVWYVVNHKSYQAEGWYLWKGDDHKYTNKTEFELESDKYGIVVGNLTSIAKSYNVCRKMLARVLSGRVVECNGWTLPGNQHLIAEARKLTYVTAYDSISNEELCIYPSVASAAIAYGVTPKVIKSRCRKEINTVVKGALFKYTYQ